MNTITLTICIIIILCIVSALLAKDKDYDDARMIRAIIQVESEGDCNAVGDGGKAVGCLQIWPIYVDDVNRILRCHKDFEIYRYQDRLDRDDSIGMFYTYTNHYIEAFKLPNSWEWRCRLHHSGPISYKTKESQGYWKKVLKAYKEIK